MEARYPNLLKPITIQGKVFKNRMIVAPLSGGPRQNTNYILHRDNIDYYEALGSRLGIEEITGNGN